MTKAAEPKFTTWGDKVSEVRLVWCPDQSGWDVGVQFSEDPKGFMFHAYYFGMEMPDAADAVRSARAVRAHRVIMGQHAEHMATLPDWEIVK